jgi:hypothetical protein
VIKEADKGNAVVILDREYYRDKILDMKKRQYPLQAMFYLHLE